MPGVSRNFYILYFWLLLKGAKRREASRLYLVCYGIQLIEFVKPSEDEKFILRYVYVKAKKNAHKRVRFKLKLF